MTASPIQEKKRRSPISQYTLWKTRWIFIGLGFILLWRCSAFIDYTSLTYIPWWVLLIITALLPQVFLLVFPIVTRNPHENETPEKRPPTRFLVEFGIAIPVVIGTMALIAAVDYIVGQLSPGTSLEPEALTDMTKSPSRMYVGLWLLFSFTFAPISEEVFFRGFLHNALRRRMPIIFAILTQTLIFGFCHFFGALHSGVAFVLGLILTLVYTWRKTLLTPILVHAGINFVSSLGMVAMMIAHATSPVLGVGSGPDDAVCVIRHIKPDSAAEEAEFQIGDIITSIDDESVNNFTELVEALGTHRAGDSILVAIDRAGIEFEISVVLQMRGNWQL